MMKGRNVLHFGFVERFAKHQLQNSIPLPLFFFLFQCQFACQYCCCGIYQGCMGSGEMTIQEMIEYFSSSIVLSEPEVNKLTLLKVVRQLN